MSETRDPNPYIVRDALADLAKKYHAESAYGREARKTLALWESLHPETVFPRASPSTERPT